MSEGGQMTSFTVCVITWLFWVINPFFYMNQEKSSSFVTSWACAFSKYKFLDCGKKDQQFSTNPFSLRFERANNFNHPQNCPQITKKKSILKNCDKITTKIAQKNLHKIQFKNEQDFDNCKGAASKRNNANSKLETLKAKLL